MVSGFGACARTLFAIHQGVPRCEQPEFVVWYGSPLSLSLASVPFASGEIPHTGKRAEEKLPVILAFNPSNHPSVDIWD